MAKYSDYVKEDQIDQELQEVQKRNIPDSVLRRFDGKSTEDILESYAELQRMSSQQGEELGSLRKTVGDLVTLQSQASASVAEPAKAKPIKVDDLYDNPERAIEQVVEQSPTSKRVTELEAQLLALAHKEKVVELSGKYPTWKEDIKNPEFLDWIKASPARTRMAIAGDRGDFDSANDLLELWANHTSKEQEVQNQLSREKQFRDATLESSSPVGVDIENVYSRSDLLTRRMAAKRGDQEQIRYLQANSESIALAYEEGRLIP